MEASALTHAGRRGLLVRRSPVLRLQGDERLIAMMREGHVRAFEVLFDRYHGRLLAFCRHMLPSQQDAEDVLQDVFVSAHKAILADNRHIKVKPWLYRIARNRCLNHLRRPVPEGSDELMDEHVGNGGTTTADEVQTRQELREILHDVTELPETQRTALLLREVDALSYAEIAETMDTTIPAVKSLLVRARITLAESSQARLLTCNEVQIELAEAAEGLGKASGPTRQHIKGCESCQDFRKQLRTNGRAFAVLFPLGPLVMLKQAAFAKLGWLGASSASSVGAGAATASGAGGAAAAAGGGAAASGIGSAAAAAAGSGGLGAIGGAIGTKAVAGVATAAIVAAGAVEVKRHSAAPIPPAEPAIERSEASKPASAAAPARAEAKPAAEGSKRSEASAASVPAASESEGVEVEVIEAAPAPAIATDEASTAAAAATGEADAPITGGTDATAASSGSAGSTDGTATSGTTSGPTTYGSTNSTSDSTSGTESTSTSESTEPKPTTKSALREPSAD